MSKKQGTIPKKNSRILLSKDNFDSWVNRLKKKHGYDILRWPAHAREWYRSVDIKTPTGSAGVNK